MVDEFLRKVREIELDRHFLDVPSKGVDFLPEEKGKRASLKYECA
jgi:hypothetical protein